MPIHVIFEGAELAGKSWLMSQVYNHIEPMHNSSGYVLDGCHWFNCDNGIFGTSKGEGVINGYLEIFEELNDSNIIVEKFHLSDRVNNRLHQQLELDYSQVESALADMDFKLVLVTFKEDMELIEQRIQDRLNLYPHYEKILQKPAFYIEQQQELIKEVENSKLPHLIVETDKLPHQKPVDKIINWLDKSR